MEEKLAYRNFRVNALASAAFIVVILCVAVTVFMTVEDEFAKGIITLVLGRFLGYVDNVYSFEFGTTRGAKTKDDVIMNLSASSPTAPSRAAQAAIDSTLNPTPVVTPGPPTKDGIIPAAEAVSTTPKKGEEK